MLRLRHAAHGVGHRPRYSSDEQKDSSIDNQIADCMEIARREGYKVAKQFIFEDRAISGTSRFGRSGMDSLIDAVRARKFDVLLCESQSRLNRDIEDRAFLSKRLLSNEIILHTYHDGLVPLDDMMGNIRAVIDAQYSKTLSKNVKQGMRGRARLGLRPGQLTYGYKLVEGGRPGEWEIDPEKAKIVQRIFREYVAEVSVRDIAVGLTRDKIPTPKKRGGTAWGHQAFLGGGDGGMLSNRLYAGESVYGRQYFVKDHDTHKTSKRWRPESEWIVTPVPHLQIVDSKTWDAAQRLRASRQPLKVSGEVVIRQTVLRNKGHLLAGLLGCGKCGGKMISSNVSRGRTCVKCASAHLKTSCDHRRAYDIDKLKKIVVDNYCADDPEFEALMRRAYNLQFSKSARRDNDDERAEVEGQIAKLKIQQARIADLIIDATLTSMLPLSRKSSKPRRFCGLASSNAFAD